MSSRRETFRLEELLLDPNFDAGDWEECQDEEESAILLWWWRFLGSMIAITVVGAVYYLFEQKKTEEEASASATSLDFSALNSGVQRNEPEQALPVSFLGADSACAAANAIKEAISAVEVSSVQRWAPPNLSPVQKFHEAGVATPKHAEDKAVGVDSAGTPKAASAESTDRAVPAIPSELDAEFERIASQIANQTEKALKEIESDEEDKDGGEERPPSRVYEQSITGGTGTDNAGDSAVVRMGGRDMDAISSATSEDSASRRLNISGDGSDSVQKFRGDDTVQRFKEDDADSQGNVPIPVRFEEAPGIPVSVEELNRKNADLNRQAAEAAAQRIQVPGAMETDGASTLHMGQRNVDQADDATSEESSSLQNFPGIISPDQPPPVPPHNGVPGQPPPQAVSDQMTDSQYTLKEEASPPNSEREKLILDQGAESVVASNTAQMESQSANRLEALSKESQEVVADGRSSVEEMIAAASDFLSDQTSSVLAMAASTTSTAPADGTDNTTTAELIFHGPQVTSESQLQLQQSSANTISSVQESAMAGILTDALASDSASVNAGQTSSLQEAQVMESPAAAVAPTSDNQASGGVLETAQNIAASAAEFLSNQAAAAQSSVADLQSQVASKFGQASESDKHQTEQVSNASKTPEEAPSQGRNGSPSSIEKRTESARLATFEVEPAQSQDERMQAVLSQNAAKAARALGQEVEAAKDGAQAIHEQAGALAHQATTNAQQLAAQIVPLSSAPATESTGPAPVESEHSGFFAMKPEQNAVALTGNETGGNVAHTEEQTASLLAEASEYLHNQASAIEPTLPAAFAADEGVQGQTDHAVSAQSQNMPGQTAQDSSLMQTAQNAAASAADFVKDQTQAALSAVSAAAQHVQQESSSTQQSGEQSMTGAETGLTMPTINLETQAGKDSSEHSGFFAMKPPETSETVQTKANQPATETSRIQQNAASVISQVAEGFDGAKDAIAGQVKESKENLQSAVDSVLNEAEQFLSQQKQSGEATKAQEDFAYSSLNETETKTSAAQVDQHDRLTEQAGMAQQKAVAENVQSVATTALAVAQPLAAGNLQAAGELEQALASEKPSQEIMLPGASSTAVAGQEEKAIGDDLQGTLAQLADTAKATANHLFGGTSEEMGDSVQSPGELVKSDVTPQSQGSLTASDTQAQATSLEAQNEEALLPSAENLLAKMAGITGQAPAPATDQMTSGEQQRPKELPSVQVEDVTGVEAGSTAGSVHSDSSEARMRFAEQAQPVLSQDLPPSDDEEPSATTAPEIESYVAADESPDSKKAGRKGRLRSQKTEEGESVEELPLDGVPEDVRIEIQALRDQDRKERTREGSAPKMVTNVVDSSFRITRNRSPLSGGGLSPGRSTKEDSSSSSASERLSSILSVVGVTSLQEALQRINTLGEIQEIMRKAGLETSNLIFGIDYTASNKYQGEKCFGGRSLHSINDDVYNPYQEVIRIMGKTLAPFATSGQIPAFGFGDVHTSDWSVFSLKNALKEHAELNPKDPDLNPLLNTEFCSNFDEVLAVYNAVTPRTILSGPTNFAPLILQAIDICKQHRDYHILVIVADGQVTNERATRRAIVEACKYPLSIIVVGVGDGPWDMMKVFDDSLPKRPWDNFHFVEFQKIVAETETIGAGLDLSFAIHSLLEIPDQYKKIKSLGLLPTL